MLPLRARVDLGAMAMKEYSTFHMYGNDDLRDYGSEKRVLFMDFDCPVYVSRFIVYSNFSKFDDILCVIGCDKFVDFWFWLISWGFVYF